MQEYIDYNEVYPGIYIGGCDASKDKNLILEKNIKVIVNCTKDLPNHFEPTFLTPVNEAPEEVQKWIYDNSPKYYRLAIDDNGKEREINNFYNLSSQIVNELEEEYKQEKHILIHCLAGIQRSCSLTAFLLMKITGKKLNEVVNIIVNHRKQAFFGGRQLNFKEALIKIEKDLYGDNNFEEINMNNTFSEFDYPTNINIFNFPSTIM